jgi:hypothetical protein
VWLQITVRVELLKGLHTWRGRHQSLPVNVRLSRNWLYVTNTLAYYRKGTLTLPKSSKYRHLLRAPVSHRDMTQ